MDTITENTLNELETLAQQTSNGVWVSQAQINDAGAGLCEVWAHDEREGDRESIAQFCLPENAAFLAVSHRAVPALINALREAWRSNWLLQSEKDHLHRCEDALIECRRILLEPGDVIAVEWLPEVVGHPDQIPHLLRARLDQLQTELAAMRRERELVIGNSAQGQLTVTEETVQPAFKVGDRVKCISDLHAYMGYKGQIGTIFKVTPHSVYAYEVRFENGAEHVFKASELMYADYRAARGIFHWQPGDEPAEVMVRRIRDGGNLDIDYRKEVEYARYKSEAERDHITPLSYGGWLKQHEPTDWNGFTFTKPQPSAPVRFFDDDARKAMEETL